MMFANFWLRIACVVLDYYLCDLQMHYGVLDLLVVRAPIAVLEVSTPIFLAVGVWGGGR